MQSARGLAAFAGMLGLIGVAGCSPERGFAPSEARRSTAEAGGMNISRPAATELSVSCAEERGEEAAGVLASRCAFVSPATHPPCNPANPCAMIEDEIQRVCSRDAWKDVAECTGPTKDTPPDRWRVDRGPYPGSV